MDPKTTISNLFFIFFTLISSLGFSQVGIGTTLPTPGSILDISSADKGILVPRINISNINSIAPISGGSPQGLLVWNTNVVTGIGFYYWDGSIWNSLDASSPRADNGLYYDAVSQEVRMGGDLLVDTLVSQGDYDLTYNLDGNGEFIIQDNGTSRFQVLNTGRIEMSNNIDASGAQNTGTLEIANNLRLDGNEIITNTNSVLYLNNDNNGDVRVDGNTLQVDASTNRIGIRTTTPDFELDVAGNIGHNNYMYHNGDTNTYWRFPANDQIRIQAGGVRMLDFIEDANDSAVFNENSLDMDVRIESDNQENQFFIDGGNDRMGIRTNTPANFFEMTNGGQNVGATAMAAFNNIGDDGVALAISNSGTINPYNAVEGISNYSGNAFLAAGVFGLAINGDLTHTAVGVRGAANGRDGIGVYGSRQNTGGIIGWGGVFYNDLGYTGFFGAVSDKKTKRNVKEINQALNIVNKLKPVAYNFDLNKYPNMGLNTEKEYGFIAQELRKILPEITREKRLQTNATKEILPNTILKNESEKFVMIDYTKLIPILTKAIKEQQEIIINQEDRLKVLEVKMASLLNKN